MSPCTSATYAFILSISPMQMPVCLYTYALCACNHIFISTCLGQVMHPAESMREIRHLWIYFMAWLFDVIRILIGSNRIWESIKRRVHKSEWFGGGGVLMLYCTGWIRKESRKEYNDTLPRSLRSRYSAASINICTIPIAAILNNNTDNLTIRKGIPWLYTDCFRLLLLFHT